MSFFLAMPSFQVLLLLVSGMGYLTTSKSLGCIRKTIPPTPSPVHLHSTARLFDPAHRTGKRLPFFVAAPLSSSCLTKVWVESTTVWQGNLAKVQIIFIISVKECTWMSFFLNQQIEDSPIQYKQHQKTVVQQITYPSHWERQIDSKPPIWRAYLPWGWGWGVGPNLPVDGPNDYSLVPYLEDHPN